MIGTIERVKNSVLLKCTTLNDKVIENTLNDVIETRIYRFAEEMVSLVTNLNLNELELRDKTNSLITKLITKKIKRKLFIDSLALQITNDTFIEDYSSDKLSIDDIKNNYLKELNKNKNSNQLNMIEDLNLSEILENLNKYINDDIINKIKENSSLVTAIITLEDNLKKELEKDLNNMIIDTDNNYLNILLEEIDELTKEKEVKKKGAEPMKEEVKEPVVIEEKSLKFEKYDDMTLYNKLILCLNTEEEKLARKENKLEEKKKEVEERLTLTNKNIEANIERENALSQRKLELNNKEIELNSKLSEAEVIFLNMKPLIKGLSNISSSSSNGGSSNE